MEKINEEQLKRNLKRLNIKPDEGWKSSTLDMLIEADVPKSTLERKHSISNLLSFINMKSTQKILVGVFVGIFMLFAVGGVAVYASDDAVPGDPLYGLDKAW